MKLATIKNFSEERIGGLKQLAADVSMSEQNLHRCIRNNKIQASDLENIARVLGVSIGVFFDTDVLTGAESPSKQSVRTEGDYSPASVHGNVRVQTGGAASEKVRYLEQIIAEKDKVIAEKERLIQVLMSK